ncbi:MAG: putative metal-binding membrane protein [Paracoccaceae bacterium]|jgi:predicted metal-binding membrane protein
MGAPHWLALFGLILGAWVMLYLMAVPADLRAVGAIYGADFWVNFCNLTPDAAGMARMVAMWVLMSAAMMAPTVLPALATYEDLGQTGTATSMARLLAGYLTIWLGFSLLAAGAQMGLFRAGLLDPLGQSATSWLTAGLLLLAGLYQFSPMKDACLSKCRQPLTFFMSHWAEGPWRNGLRLGLVCLGCCWALMMLAFVGGVMNLAFMGLATLVMVLEKLPEIGRYITRPLGVALLTAAAGWTLAHML